MRKGFEIITYPALVRFAKLVARRIRADVRKRERAYIILLSGNLGSGKTTFVQALAKLLGISEKVLSPTFVFVHEHTIRKPFPFKNLIHVDAYRIDTKREFESIGIKRYLKDPTNLVFVEWGGKIASWIPEPNLSVQFRHHRPTSRLIKIK